MSTDTPPPPFAAAPHRVAIVGPGAIGTVIAAALHEAGRTPLLCGHTPRDGLTLLIGAQRIEVPGPVLVDPGEPSSAFDIVFLSVKATQTAAAAAWLRRLCDEGTCVCVLQNGVEQVESVRPWVPADCDVVPAVVWFPAEARGDGTVDLRGDPRVTVPASPAGRRVAALLRDTRCDVDTAQDFVTAAWSKLLRNAAAGLMALTGRRMGVFGRADVGEVARAYLGECLTVARAEGADLDDGFPDHVLAGFRAAPADLGTSILADRVLGRQLEWDVRNGVISRMGRRHGVPTPIADVITALLAATSDGPG